MGLGMGVFGCCDELEEGGCGMCFGIGGPTLNYWLGYIAALLATRVSSLERWCCCWGIWIGVVIAWVWGMYGGWGAF